MADPTTDFATLQSTLTSSLLSTTRAVNALCAEDLAFHRSLSPATAASLDAQNARLLALAERLLGNAAVGSEVVRPKLAPALHGDGDGAAGLDEAEWGRVVDVVDSLLERADSSLDEFTGVVKRLSPGMEQQVWRFGNSGGSVWVCLGLIDGRCSSPCRSPSRRSR